MFEVYKDEAGAWRWRVIAANNRIVGSSGESFGSRSNALRALTDLITMVSDADEISIRVVPGNGESNG